MQPEPEPEPQPHPQCDLEFEPKPEAAPPPRGVFAPAQRDKLERIFSGGDTTPSDTALQMYAAVIGRPPGGWQSDPHTDLAAWFARKNKGANTFSSNGLATAAAKVAAAAAPGAPPPTQVRPPPDVEILMGMGYDRTFSEAALLSSDGKLHQALIKLSICDTDVVKTPEPVWLK